MAAVPNNDSNKVWIPKEILEYFKNNNNSE